MRGQNTYLWQQSKWPAFSWREAEIGELLSSVRFEQGRLLGRMEALGFELESTAELEARTEEAINTASIEGEELGRREVRSSVARQLGLPQYVEVDPPARVDGLVRVLFDATINHAAPLTPERLHRWHSSLFPENVSIAVGSWRDDRRGPMQVVSGPMGKETIHFEAPPAQAISPEMDRFLRWFNRPPALDPVVKAAIAHLWFLTIHPFEDGNGRIARALTEMLLARSERSPRRFYSMSDRILRTREDYYRHLEWTQKGDLDITSWIKWFLASLYAALQHSDQLLSGVIGRSEFWRQVASESLNERQLSVLRRMLDNRFEGFMTSSKWARMTKVSQDTAGRDISDLLAKGILVRNEAGGRSTSYRIADQRSRIAR